MLTVGVDPGSSGALVALLNRRQPIAHLTMPTVKVGKATRVDGASVARWLRSMPVQHVYIEAVHSMPRDGGASAFTFGHAAGLVEGVVQALGLPYTLVTPQKWKREHGLIGTDKDAARSRAIQLWPEWAELGTKVRGQGLADAALIALCAGDT